MLFDIVDDGLVHGLAAYFNALAGCNAAQAQHRHIGGTAADVYDHGAGRLIYRQTGAQRCGHGLVDQLHILRTGAAYCVLHGTALYLGDPGGHADDHPGLGKHGALVRAENKAVEHIRGHIKVGDNAVFQRSHGHNGAGGAADHLLGLGAGGNHTLGLYIYGYHAGLPHNNAALAVADHGGGSTQVDTNIS